MKKKPTPKQCLLGAELREANPFPWFDDFSKRAVAVIDFAFGGMHHVHSARWERGHLRCAVYGGASTWDNACLTKLVVAAHEQCVRVEVLSGGPRQLGIIVSRRVPIAESGEYPIMKGHPTLREHLDRLGRSA